MENLDSLAGLALDADKDKTLPVDGGPAADMAPAPPGPEEQAFDLITGFAGVLAGYAPDTAEIWTVEARTAAAAALAPVMVKYNFSLMAIPCELTAAIVVGPLLYRSATIVGEKIKADRQAREAAKGNPPPRPGAAAQVASGATEDGSSPAAPVHPQMAMYKQ